MKVSKEAIWQSRGSLQRFGTLAFKDKSLNWKAGRIHRAATKVAAQLAEDNQDAIQKFGIEVERPDERGNPVKVFEVQKDQKVEFLKAWRSITDEIAEFWGDPIKIDDLPPEFWGRDEVKDAEGKITQTALQPMMSIQDIGALGDWLFVGEGSGVAKAQAASGGD